jgi:F-type H+-transporting ATPase subunit alpha
MSVQDQIVSIWTVTNGYLDDVPVSDVRRFERELLDFMGTTKKDIGQKLVETGKLEEELEGQLREAVEEFKKSFHASEEHTAPKSEEPVEAQDEDEQERLQRRRPKPPEKQGM